VATQTYIDSIQLSNGDEYTYLKNFNNNINGTFYFGVSKKIDFKKFYLQSEIDLSANYFISKYEESYTQYYYFNGFRYLDVIERNGIKKVNSISSNLLNFLPKYRFCLLAGKQINSKTSLTACFTYENTPKLFKGTGGNFSIVSNPNSFSRKELEISNYHQFLIFTIGMNYKF
jgi:hypothetical protein